MIIKIIMMIIMETIKRIIMTKKIIMIMMIE